MNGEPQTPQLPRPTGSSLVPWVSAEKIQALDAVATECMAEALCRTIGEAA